MPGSSFFSNILNTVTDAATEQSSDTFSTKKSKITSASNKNILDDYDVSTYHLQLFAAEFTGSLTDEAIANKNPAFIIAETGVTDIGIDNLKFDSFFGFQQSTYTSFATVFDFELREPLGTTLLDRMKYAAKRMGVDNFVKMPLFLRISFYGRDKATGEAVTPIDGGTVPAVRTYPIHISDMKIRVDKGGSVYTCKAVRVNDYAFDNYMGTIRQKMNLKVENLEDTLTELKDYLNDPKFYTQQEASFKAKGDATEVYDFIIDPEIKKDGGIEFRTGSKSAWNSNRNGSFEEFSVDKTIISIDKGTSINRLIDILMVNTQYLQKNIKKDQDDTMKNENEARALKDVYKIRSEIEFTGYDTGVDDFVRKITYYIEPFTLGTADAVTRPKEKETPDSIKADYLGPQGTNGEVVKNYYYIYTGKNYHVLDFDIKINFAWFTALAQQYGHYGVTSQDAGVLYYTQNSQDPTSSIETKKMADLENSSGSQILSIKSPPGDKLYLTRDHRDTIGIFIPTVRELPSQQDGAGIIEGERHAARDQTAALLKTYVERAQSEFVVIEVEIRGDPYWFTVENEKILYFTFSTGFPDEPGPDGRMILTTEHLISGLYQILKVSNQFSGGKFTQTLNARRDILTKLGTPSFVGDVTDSFPDIGNTA